MAQKWAKCDGLYSFTFFQSSDTCHAFPNERSELLKKAHRAVDVLVSMHGAVNIKGKTKKKSRTVCLQEIYMAPISEIIILCGAGTLSSNIYLNVTTAKLMKNETVWLQKYLMGPQQASCTQYI